MSVRSLLYWFICITFAVYVAQAAEPLNPNPAASWSGGSALESKLLPVPEPGRALLLFAGVMAMAFTYRRAWLNWKMEPKA
jgi:hypothetical protein